MDWGPIIISFGLGAFLGSLYGMFVESHYDGPSNTSGGFSDKYQ